MTAIIMRVSGAADNYEPEQAMGKRINEIIYYAIRNDGIDDAAEDSLRHRGEIFSVSSLGFQVRNDEALMAGDQWLGVAELRGLSYIELSAAEFSDGTRIVFRNF